MANNFQSQNSVELTKGASEGMPASRPLPNSSHGAKSTLEPSKALNPYLSAAQKKQTKKNAVKKPVVNSASAVVPSGSQNQIVANILKKDHHDSNMVVSVRVRPLSSKEIHERNVNII